MYRLWIIPLSFLIASCAGPTHPWGNHGITLPTQKFSQESLEVNNKGIMSRIPQQVSRATIEFYPKKQNLTELSDFTIVIDNKEMIERDFKLQLFYNHYDVTDSWLKHSKVSYNSKYTKAKIEFKGLRLLADHDHEVLVKFQNDIYTAPNYYKFEEPQCDLSSYSPLKGVPPFEVDEQLTKSIEEIAKVNNVNPRFIAGLIAQESAFNPKAVSHAKAIGLTQVTNLAQTHVLEEKNLWPTNTAIKKYSVPIIKTMILTGTINPKNEWRLNERQSIEGGITFLKYLEDYWTMPENRQLIQKHYGEKMNIMNDLILASYNSGAYRVKVALKKYGRSWKKESEQLNEARKYVKKVKSYCYHFEKEAPLSVAQMD